MEAAFTAGQFGVTLRLGFHPARTRAAFAMKKILLSLLAVLLLVEEWLWDMLTALGRRLSAWLHLARLESWLATARADVAMAAFVLPLALILPVKFAAFMLMARGQIILGIGLFFAAKLFVTLLIARIFTITRSQLLSIAWFAALYGTITRWLGWAHGLIRGTAAYQQMVGFKQAVKDWMGRV